METQKKTLAAFVPHALIVLQSVIYGFGDPISKVAYESVPVFTLLTVRYLIAFLFLMLLFGKCVMQEVKTVSVKTLLPPCLCIAGTYLIGNVALVLTAATSVAFLRSLSTVITPLLAFFVYRQKFSKKLLPIYLFVVIGLYLLCGLGGLSRFGLGEICALGAATLAAGTLLFGEHSLNSVSAVTLTTVQAAASTLLALICALFFDGGVALSGISPLAWGIILYLAITCTALGYLLQNIAMCSISSRTVALLQCLCPVMTGVFSYFILREHLTAAGLLGSGIILGCVAAEILLNQKKT